MAQIWTEGKVEEYANGFFGTVVYQRGKYAVLKEHPDPRYDRPIGYFIAYADEPEGDDGDFAWSSADEVHGGEDVIYSTQDAAVAACVLLHEGDH